MDSVILRPDSLLSIHLTTYLTEAMKFHKAFSSYMKNIIKTNYILVVTVNTLDISKGTLFSMQYADKNCRYERHHY